MQDIYDFIDNYIKLSYVVRGLNARLNKLPDFMYDSSVICDYRALGISDEVVAKIQGYDIDFEEYESLTQKVSSLSSKIYDTICILTPDLKYDLYDYLLVRCYTLAEQSDIVQKDYMKTVAQIEAADKKDDTQLIRKLGKIAKVQYCKYYELDSLKNGYAYLGSYMSSMVGHKFSEDFKAESGLTL